MSLETILLFINILLCAFIIVGSFIYFLKNKSKFRWVKLFWALEISVYLFILVWTALGCHVTLLVQYLAMMLPLTAIMYGLITAFARSKEISLYYKLEEKFNGQLERWINRQIDSFPEEK
jgi:uncharacterized membrane protein HdeD (DUF308 family)